MLKKLLRVTLLHMKMSYSNDLVRPAAVERMESS